MSFSQLNAASFLTPGSQLWVITSYSQSHFVKKLDWYLNFIIHKQDMHTRATLSQTLITMNQENELGLKLNIQNDEASSRVLLLPTEHAFPNRWLAVYDDVKNPNAFAKQIVQLWEGLQKPTIRIFVPANLNVSDLQSALDFKDSGVDVTFIAEPST